MVDLVGPLLDSLGVDPGPVLVEASKVWQQDKFGAQHPVEIGRDEWRDTIHLLASGNKTDLRKLTQPSSYS